MGAQRSTPVFKAGNFKAGYSKAVRLPAGYPLNLGQEVAVRGAGGRYVIEPVLRDEARIAALQATFGCMPRLRPLAPEDRKSEERGLDWDLTHLKRA